MQRPQAIATAGALTLVIVGAVLALGAARGLVGPRANTPPVGTFHPAVETATTHPTPSPSGALSRSAVPNRADDQNDHGTNDHGVDDHRTDRRSAGPSPSDD